MSAKPTSAEPTELQRLLIRLLGVTDGAACSASPAIEKLMMAVVDEGILAARAQRDAALALIDAIAELSHRINDDSDRNGKEEAKVSEDADRPATPPSAMLHFIFRQGARTMRDSDSDSDSDHDCKEETKVDENADRPDTPPVETAFTVTGQK